MEYDIRFEFPLTKAQLKQIGLTYHCEGNGIFWYNKDLIVINVGSTDFEDIDEDGIIEVFTQIDTHERLHREIYKATGKV